MTATRLNYQIERDRAITDLYKRNLSARQIAYNLNIQESEVLEVIDLLNLKEIKNSGDSERAARRRAIEDHQAKHYENTLLD